MSGDKGLESAFRLAQTKALDTGEEMAHEDIVFEALVEAMATLKKLPDPEAGWLFANSFFPRAIADREDDVARYREAMDKIVAGQPPSIMSRRPLGPGMVERARAMIEQLPRYLAGPRRGRDWKILLAFANGLTVRQVASVAECAPTTAWLRKSVQLKAISLAAIDLLPPPLGMSYQVR